MAGRGLHLERASLFAYTFRRGPARDMVYRLSDASASDQTNALLAAAGWTRVSCTTGWVIWSQRAARLRDGWDARLSRTQRYWRALVLQFCFAIPLLALIAHAGVSTVALAAATCWAVIIGRLVIRLRAVPVG